MKSTLSIFFIFFTFIASAQETGKITTKENFPKAGIENTYIYTPPKSLSASDSLQAVILFLQPSYTNKTVWLNKEGDEYTFKLKVPDSTSVLIIGIKDKKKEIVDNNNGHGYISYFFDKNNQKINTADLQLATMLLGFSNYYLKVTETNTSILKLYEDVYKKYPALKYKNGYSNYLSTLYGVKKDTAKPKIIAYTKKIEAENPGENNLSEIKYLYELMGMKDEGKRIKDIILKKYPQGQIAKGQFWEKYFSEEKKSEESILLSMKDYIEKFKDTSARVKQNFYSDLLSFSIKEKNWNNIIKYEQMIPYKASVAEIYNNYAWNMCGSKIEESAKEPEFAKMISRRSIDLIETSIKEQDDNANLWSSWDAYMDTYALLLYKQQQYDSAFYYQDTILKRNSKGMSAEGKERYAAFASSVKGPEFTKQFIENELSNGVISAGLLNQLQVIYKKLNLSDEEFAKIKTKADAVVKEKMMKLIKSKLGSTTAKDFTLTNLKGQKVSLSSFKNKIVVVDFWATWCGPCKASFPATQQIINKYKNRSDVAFLFIDTWERKDIKTMQKQAQDFITKNNYTFEVLLDDKDKVVGDYKVDGIPTTFVIDKNGEIAFMGHPSNDISAEIEKLKN